VRVFTHPDMLAHDPGAGHPESPARLRAVLDELRGGPLADRIAWQDADLVDLDFVRTVHAPGYVRALGELAAFGGSRIDPDTVMSAGTLDAARRAAGAAISAAAAALAGDPAFAAVRPPGHHATLDRAMGFCFFNNVVLAARAALERFGVERVLIIDWDVHHGNGTQDLVERDRRIRYVSLHEWPLYPGTGREEERGVGNVFNVPRPPGLPRARYVDDLNAAVRRATADWRPDLVLLSAGFDAMAGDPLAGFTLEPEDYATWITEWRALGAPIASVLEGGYVPARLAAGVRAHLGALSAP